MPLATVHLIALAANAGISTYLRALKSMSVKPLVISRAIRWIVKPEQLSTAKLLSTQWDLLIIVPIASQIPDTYLARDWVSEHWSITAGVPSSLVNEFAERNERILRPQSGDVPALTGSVSYTHLTLPTKRIV